MVNRAKRKGDRYELEAVGVLAGLLPALTVAKPQRMLGAGRRDDKGDLLVLADTAVQVKAWRDTVRAVTDAASGAHRQAAGWDLPYSVGMVPVLGASRFAVRWLFATHQWPTGQRPDQAATVGLTCRAIRLVRDEQCGLDRDRRVVVVDRFGLPPVYVATAQAWAAAYRDAHPGPVRPFRVPAAPGRRSA